MKTFQHIFNQEIDPAFALRSEFIFRHIEKNKSQTVLDAGCGRGYYVKLISMLPSTKKVVGIDINKEYLKRAQAVLKNEKKAEIKQASIYKLPFADNTFDAVICSEILEHLDDEATALKEIYRVLKPKGIFLASVPHQNFPFLWDPLNWVLMKFFNTHVPKHIWWLAGIWADHERLYTKKGLVTTIQKQKFVVESRKEFIRWCWPFTHFFLYGIGKNIVERMGASEFDRFNIDQEKPLSRFIAFVVRLPSLLLDKTLPISVSQTLAIAARKK